MQFEWDESKNELSIQKHGIDFRDVIDMFNYPMLIALDTRRDYGEDRWIGIGLLRGLIAVVVYVEIEDEDKFRIISARKATKHESHEYLKSLPH
jgi:uncharacterized protein